MKLLLRASLFAAALVGSASAAPKTADDLNSVTTKLTDVTEADAVDLAKVKGVSIA